VKYTRDIKIAIFDEYRRTLSEQIFLVDVVVEDHGSVEKGVAFLPAGCRSRRRGHTLPAHTVHDRLPLSRSQVPHRWSATTNHVVRTVCFIKGSAITNEECRRGAHFPFLGHESVGGQSEARPTVTFPAAWHHHPLTGTKLYCLVTEAHVCE